MQELFGLFEQLSVRRCTFFSDQSSGLRALLVLDDLTLGPATGGVRTSSYASIEDAVLEASQLAKAMTQKCALADLGAGGGSIVVLEHGRLDRQRAFEALGAHIESLEGLFRASGDFGTTQADLRAMARRTRYVESDEERLARSVALGVLRCIEALQQFRGLPARVEGLRIAIQGCGVIGTALGRLLAEEKAELLVTDLVEEKARTLAEETDAQVIAPDDIIHVEADILAPCAHGNWLDAEAAEAIAARAVCGATRNLLAGVEGARRLQTRGILHVPDSITAAGAVIESIGRTVMGLPDRTPLIEHLGRTALLVLRNARDKGLTPHEAAEILAENRLEEAQ